MWHVREPLTEELADFLQHDEAVSGVLCGLFGVFSLSGDREMV